MENHKLENTHIFRGSHREVNKSMKNERFKLNPNLSKSFNTNVMDFKFAVNEDINIMSPFQFGKMENYQLENTHNFRGSHTEITESMKNGNSKPELNLSKPSNTNVEDFKFVENDNINVILTSEFRGTDDYQQNYSYNIQGRHRGYNEKFKNNKSLKPKLNVSKSLFTSIDNFQRIQNDDLNLTPAFEFGEMANSRKVNESMTNKNLMSKPNLSNTSIEDFKFVRNKDFNISTIPGFDEIDSYQLQNLPDNHRGVNEILMNKSIKPKSNSSKLLNSSIDKFKFVLNEDLNMTTLPLLNKMVKNQSDDVHNIQGNHTVPNEILINKSSSLVPNLSKSLNTSVEEFKFVLNENSNTITTSGFHTKVAKHLYETHSIQGMHHHHKYLNTKLGFHKIISDRKDETQNIEEPYTTLYKRFKQSSLDTVLYCQRGVNEILTNNSLIQQNNVSKSLNGSINNFKFVVNEDLNISTMSGFNNMDSNQLDDTHNTHEYHSAYDYGILMNKSSKPKSLNTNVDNFKVIQNENFNVTPLYGFHKIDDYQPNYTHNIQRSHKEVDEMLMNTDLKLKLNTSKPSNTSVDNFKVLNDNLYDVTPTSEFHKKDYYQKDFSYNNIYHNNNYIQESHRKEYDVLRNLNLKPKPKLSKSSTSVEDIKFSQNNNLNIIPTSKFDKINNYQQDNTHSITGSHGEVDRMLMNESLGPKSNLSKSSNINVDNFKDVNNDDLKIFPISGFNKKNQLNDSNIVQVNKRKKLQRSIIRDKNKLRTGSMANLNKVVMSVTTQMSVLETYKQNTNINIESSESDEDLEENDYMFNAINVINEIDENLGLSQPLPTTTYCRKHFRPKDNKMAVISARRLKVRNEVQMNLQKQHEIQTNRSEDTYLTSAPSDVSIENRINWSLQTSSPTVQKHTSV